MVSAFADRLKNAALPGFGVKAPVLFASTGNVTLSGSSLSVYDGVTPSSGDRGLFWQQNSTRENGIYFCPGATGTWQRDADFQGNSDVTMGTLVPVSTGALYGSKFGQVISTGSGNNGRHIFNANSTASDNISFQMQRLQGSSGADGGGVLSGSTGWLAFYSTGSTSLRGSSLGIVSTAGISFAGLNSSGAFMSGTTSSGGAFNSGLFDASTFGASSTNVFYDTGSIFAHSTAPTAGFRFSSSAITAGQTRVLTVQDTNQTLLASDVANQQITGGAKITSLSVNSSTGLLLNYGNRPLQFTTNNSSGGFSITASTSDGSGVLLVTNSSIAGSITLVNFSTATNTGDTYATTNGNKYKFYFDTVNSVSSYTIQGMQ